MSYYVAKIVVTALLVVIISEAAKRSSAAGALLASIPLTSVLAMIWLYGETKSIEKVSALASSIFWLVIPSLSLFIALPLFLKHGFGFYISLGFSIILTACVYLVMAYMLGSLGIKL